MKRIRDIVRTPSAALQAMVDGLREQSKREDFQIDMTTFGKHDKGKGIFYGDAATCATQKIFGVNLASGAIYNFNQRAIIYKHEYPVDLHDFEYAINAARVGLMSDLFMYYGVPTRLLYDNITHPQYQLDTHNWEPQLPMVEEYISYIKQQGF